MNLLKIIHQNISSYLNDSIYNLKNEYKNTTSNSCMAGDQDCGQYPDSLGQNHSIK